MPGQRRVADFGGQHFSSIRDGRADQHVDVNSLTASAQSTGGDDRRRRDADDWRNYGNECLAHGQLGRHLTVSSRQAHLA